jgi:hypothetical protein
MFRRALLPFLTISALACGGSDDTDTSEEAAGTETSSDSDSGTETTETGDGDGETGDGDGDGDGTTGDGDGATGDGDGDGSADPPPATGIQIVDVTVDQGIRIPIVVNGSPVPSGQQIIDGRPAVIRAFWDVDPGFETRNIYTVLTVTTGGVETQFDRVMQAAEQPCPTGPMYTCHYGSLPTGAFWWRVPPEYIQPDTTFKIELMEASPGHENDVSAKIPNYPYDGTSADLGVDDTYMKMRVVLVPFYHNIGSNCPSAPDLNADFGTDVEGNPRTVAQFFGERLASHNPTDEVEIIVHSVENFSGSMSGSQLLGELQQLRQWENAPPGHYYYGVADPCDAGPDFSGVAQLGGPYMSDANNRVGWGVWHPSTTATAETFIHEIGHEQGRPHIRCTGEEAGVDTSYPDHPEGDTESYGMDMFSDPVALSGPSDHDYMTYCSGTWVSEWGWNLVWPWIQTISSWENPNVVREAEAAKRPVLIGEQRADGTERWWITRTWFDANRASPDHRVRYTLDGSTIESEGRWTAYHETEDHYLTLPLPDRFEAMSNVQLVTPAGTRRLDLSTMPFIGSR